MNRLSHQNANSAVEDSKSHSEAKEGLGPYDLDALDLSFMGDVDEGLKDAGEKIDKADPTTTDGCDYSDHFMDNIAESGRKFFGFECDGSGSGDNKPFKFPYLLHSVLSDDSQSHIISWEPHGRSFAIRNREEFIQKIMPRYFSTSRFSSFKRQLSWYKFKRISEGPDKGSYYHELFLRGRPDLTDRINRTPKQQGMITKGNAAKVPPSPNLYSFPFCIDLLEQDVAFLSGKSPSEIVMQKEAWTERQAQPLDQYHVEPEMEPSDTRGGDLLPLPIHTSSYDDPNRRQMIAYYSGLAV